MRTVAVVILLGLGFVLGQDKTDKEKPKPEEKLKGFLPAGFKKLGLTESQVQAVYKVQAEYRAKKDELERKLAKLKEEERASIEKVLTDEQRKELKAIRSGEKK